MVGNVKLYLVFEYVSNYLKLKIEKKIIWLFLVFIKNKFDGFVVDL